MAVIQTKDTTQQDAEKAQEKRKRPEPAPEHEKALAGESIPFPGLSGVSAMEPPLESHAAFLDDPRFSHPANDTQKAGLVTELQGNYGNQYVQRLVQSMKVQAKLTVSSPDDQYEREADRVADTVTRASAPSIQRQAEEEEEEEEEEPIQTKLTNDIQVQRQAEEPEEEEEEPIQTKKPAGQTPLISSSLQSRINSLKGGGQPLPEPIRKYFEPRFGSSFAQVWVHNNSQAANIAKSINAKAFTTGKDIVFGAGQYSPETSGGKCLLAHELTHVVQQSASPNSVSSGAKIQCHGGGPKRRPKRRRRQLLGRLKRYKNVTDEMIMNTQHYHYIIRKNVTHEAALSACRRILADVKRGVMVPFGKTMDYVMEMTITPTKREWKWIKAQQRRGAKGGGHSEAFARFRIFGFDYRSAKLKPGHIVYIHTRVIPYMFARPKRVPIWIELFGHASLSGPAAGNEALSRNRAETVMNYLKVFFPSLTCVIQAKGEKEPEDQAKTENYLDRAVVVAVHLPQVKPPPYTPEDTPEQIVKRRLKEKFSEIYRRIRLHLAECDTQVYGDLTAEGFCLRNRRTYQGWLEKSMKRDCYEVRCVKYNNKLRGLKWHVKEELAGEFKIDWVLKKYKEKFSRAQFLEYFEELWKNRPVGEK